MAKFIVNDAIVILRGLSSVSRAAINVTENELKEAWHHSSVRAGLCNINLDVKNTDVTEVLNEVKERSFAAAKGLSEFSSVSFRKLYDGGTTMQVATSLDNNLDPSADTYGVHSSQMPTGSNNIDNASMKSLAMNQESKENLSNLHTASAYPGLQGSKLLSTDGSLLNLDQKRRYKSAAYYTTTGSKEGFQSTEVKGSSETPGKLKPIARKKRVPKLSETSREVAVPSSRLERLATYGGLAASLGMGALAEITRRSLGLGENSRKEGSNMAILDSNPFLTEANAERIVNTLCKVRGAALKLGQMLSIQDNALINPQLQKIFERVRQSADFMPVKQMESVLIEELGPGWRSKLLNFQEKPFAAASVGQVHLATLRDGREVAMKIQYPGVAKGIESDINNLVAVMNVWNILPKGLYMEEFIKVAKKELAWEVDYIREKECTKRFKELLKDMPEYKVPDVIDELCTKQVFTAEFVEGITVEQCFDMDQDSRNYIAEKILWLCLTELFTFRFMQTDPNWSNFMYNPATRQVVLLDFGASREYPKSFVDNYIKVIEGAAVGDHQKVLDYSRKLGFLAGYETKAMEEAHVEAVMILGEAFRHNKPFDFGTQDTTKRIQRLIPVMLTQRLCPPPQESYSLHRKMSGAFLLCAKLGAKINCKPFFDEICQKYYSSNYPVSPSVV